MVADPLLSSEIRVLQDELSAAQRDREVPMTAAPAQAAPARAAPSQAKPPDPPVDSTDQDAAHRELKELADTLTAFFEDAEKNVAAHPIASMAGALVVGIMIGRLLRPRSGATP